MYYYDDSGLVFFWLILALALVVMIVGYVFAIRLLIDLAKRKDPGFNSSPTFNKATAMWFTGLFVPGGIIALALYAIALPGGNAAAEKSQVNAAREPKDARCVKDVDMPTPPIIKTQLKLAEICKSRTARQK